MDGWRGVGGRPRFTRASAVWHLFDGELRYAEMAPAELDHDVPPQP